MSKKKLKTINLKGKEYVQVDTRVQFFNEEYPNGSISTSVEAQDGSGYIFSAKVTPDTDKPDRFFTGHSYGEVGPDKAMEKLETVAVGRALAFMGIGIVDGIASAEEIDKFHATKNVHPKESKAWKKEAKGETHECPTCASPATRFYGVSKQGKDYNILQCDENKEHVKFLDPNPDEMLPF